MVLGDAEKKKMASLARDGVNTVIKNPSDARALARLVGGGGGGGVSTLSQVGKRILTYNNPSLGSIVQPKVAPSVSSTLMQSPTIKPSLGSIVQPKVAPSVSSTLDSVMQSPTIKPSLAPSVSSIARPTVSVAPTPSYLPVVVGVVILAFVFLR
jgi:hypothetical protein